jgi:cob(I)alamin adenosyltransferase
MGHRLSRIYTRTGDDGTTGLSDGTRVAKDDPRIEAIGAIDELNSSIGVLRCEALPVPVDSLLTAVQHSLFDLGGELSLPDRILLDADRVTLLENALDEFNKNLPPLKEFILPGGCRAAAVCHLARTVCRRAERRVFRLACHAAVNAASLQYLNRLSDLLFVVARVIVRAEGGEEVLWNRKRV